jgi:hypothetical protein
MPSIPPLPSQVDERLGHRGLYREGWRVRYTQSIGHYRIWSPEYQIFKTLGAGRAAVVAWHRRAELSGCEPQKDQDKVELSELQVRHAAYLPFPSPLHHRWMGGSASVVGEPALTTPTTSGLLLATIPPQPPQPPPPVFPPPTPCRPHPTTCPAPITPSHPAGGRETQPARAVQPGMACLAHEEFRQLPHPVTQWRDIHIALSGQGGRWNRGMARESLIL